MKKILSIIGAIGLTATTAATVVACGTQAMDKSTTEPRLPEIPDEIKLSFEEIMQITSQDALDLRNLLQDWLEENITVLNYMRIYGLIFGSEKLEELPEDISQKNFDILFEWELMYYSANVRHFILTNNSIGLKQVKVWFLDKMASVGVTSVNHKKWLLNLIDLINQAENKTLLSELLKFDSEEGYDTEIFFDGSEGEVSDDTVVEIFKDVLTRKFPAISQSEFEFKVISSKVEYTNITINLEFTVTKSSKTYITEKFERVLKAYWV